MKKIILLFLPLFLFIAGTLVSCEEVAEAGKYDNWKARNVAYLDSIKALTGENYATTIEEADKMVVGDLFAIMVPSTSTSTATQYVYCKKITTNLTGQVPLFTDEIKAFYYGTYFNGEEFDGCFKGYSALDQKIPTIPPKNPTDLDTPVSFNVNGVVPGWTWALQYMRTGERWMLYIPYQSGYGADDYTRQGSSKTIPGGSVLVFDLQLVKIID